MQDYEVEMIQRMFKGQRGISLTFEQGIEMYKYEKLRDTPSFSHHHFSTWEGLDFEFVSFQKILNPEQFVLYKKDWEASIKFQEEQLVIQDKNNISQFNAAQELFSYYETFFLPAIIKKLPFFGALFVNEWSKIVYLKGEYKKYLDDTKKSILVNHFRHSRTFQPIALELSLLLHQHDCLLPNYEQFRLKMDVPTKAIADYLFEIASRISTMPQYSFKEIFEALKEFKRANILRHIGEIQGWHTAIGAAEPLNLMPMLLMEEKMYNS